MMLYVYVSFLDNFALVTNTRVKPLATDGSHVVSQRF